MNEVRIRRMNEIGESEWTEQRIKQLQVLKDIALRSLGFVKSPTEAPNMERVPLSPILGRAMIG